MATPVEKLAAPAVRPKVFRPGPGQHDVPAAFPGTFPASRLTASPNYSVPSGRADGTPRQDKGGPGSYEPNVAATMQRTPVWKFSSQKRHLSDASKDADANGPNADQHDSMSFSRSPKYGFGRSQRPFEIPCRYRDHPDNRKNATPAPNAYNPDYVVRSNRGPSYTVPLDRDAPDPSMKAPVEYKASPGPGSYSPAQPKEGASKNHSFGRAARALAKDSVVAKKSPGPGAYSPARTFKGHGQTGSAPKWSMPGRAKCEFDKIVARF